MDAAPRRCVEDQKAAVASAVVDRGVVIGGALTKFGIAPRSTMQKLLYKELT